MTNKTNLSVVLATTNEEKVIARCIGSVKNIADEVIVFDEYSKDKTVKIAKSLGAKVFLFNHKDNFHETKQKAIDEATNPWILQLDADEVVTPTLAKEIESVIAGTHERFVKNTFTKKDLSKKEKLFNRHQKNVLGDKSLFKGCSDDSNAYFIPRVNMFLGKPLIHAGVYPDGVIRLFKKGKAYLPAKSVHELMQVEGDIGWLYSDMQHFDSPTLERYFKRANRYTTYQAKQFEKQGVKRSLPVFIFYLVVKPIEVFFKLFLRHKGFMDGIRGFLWSFFSASQFPISYIKYYLGIKK